MDTLAPIFVFAGLFLLVCVLLTINPERDRMSHYGDGYPPSSTFEE